MNSCCTKTGFTVTSPGTAPMQGAPRDGLAISNERAIVIEAGPAETELVLVDVRG